MRKLKLDEKALNKLLDELDAHDARIGAATQSTAEYFAYRVPALRVDFEFSRDETSSLIVPSRKLGTNGIYFLVSNLIHVDCTCRVHLVTVRNNWQTVSGCVAKCRYLPGTTGVHEVFVRFDRPIDPVSFATAATRSRILAVDDSFVSLKLYERLMDTMNVDLTCASNGIEAVDWALADKFDLILMDLEMPEMDGLTAVRMLRSRGYVRAIVAVSALSDPKDRERALASGCDDFLAKPLTRESLSAVVNRNKSEPLVSAMLDDPAMFELIDKFVHGLTETINRLEAACGTGNLEELGRETRAIKGEAAGIGFGSITDAAAVVENAVKREEELQNIRAKLTELIRLCMAARPATSHITDRPEAKAAVNSAGDVAAQAPAADADAGDPDKADDEALDEQED